MTSVLNVILERTAQQRFGQPNFERALRSILASKDPLRVATLCSTFCGEQVIIPPSFDDMRPFGNT